MIKTSPKIEAQNNLALTVVSTFQSPLIMMSQNRQMERDREAVQGLHAKLDAMAAQLEPVRGAVVKHSLTTEIEDHA